MILAGRMVGKQIGNYRIIGPAVPRPLADLYLALDTRQGGVVNMILLPSDAAASAGDADQFLSEARAVLGFRHPGFVPLLDCDRLNDGAVYLVSEHVEAECISGRLQRDGGIASDLALVREVVVQTAAAIGAAHDAGLRYLCLRPENMLLVPASQRGAPVTVRLLELGLGNHFLSRIRQMAPGKELPASLLRYSSPEQSRGDGVDHRSDIYALGCLLFEVLVGQPPFRETDLWGLVSAHAHDAPPRIRELRPELPSILDDLLATMLEKDPTRRPFSMGEIIAVMQVALPERASLLDEATAPPSAAIARTAILEPDASAAVPPSAPIATTVILDPEPPVPPPADALTSTPMFRATRLLTPSDAALAPMPLAVVARPHRAPGEPSPAAAETAAARHRPTPVSRGRTGTPRVQMSSRARIVVVVTLVCVALVVGLLFCFGPQASKRPRVPIEETPASQQPIPPMVAPSPPPEAIDTATPAPPQPAAKPNQPEPGLTGQPPANLGKNRVPSRRTRSQDPASHRAKLLNKDGVIEPTFLNKR